MRRAVSRAGLAGASLGFADKPLRPRFHHRRMGCNLYRRGGRFPWPLGGQRFAAQVQCLGPLSDRPLAVVRSQVSSASVPGGARALANRFSGAATWRARGDADGAANERPGGADTTTGPMRCRADPGRSGRFRAWGHRTAPRKVTDGPCGASARVGVDPARNDANRLFMRKVAPVVRKAGGISRPDTVGNATRQRTDPPERAIRQMTGRHLLPPSPGRPVVIETVPAFRRYGLAACRGTGWRDRFGGGFGDRHVRPPGSWPRLQ